MTATAIFFGLPWAVAPPARASTAAPAARPANHFAFIPATSSNQGNIGLEHQTDKLPPNGRGVAVTRVTRERFAGTLRDAGAYIAARRHPSALGRTERSVRQWPSLRSSSKISRSRGDSLRGS